jgi:hypothetical protein
MTMGRDSGDTADGKTNIADTPQALLLTCEFRERQLSCRQ